MNDQTSREFLPKRDWKKASAESNPTGDVISVRIDDAASKNEEVCESLSKAREVAIPTAVVCVIILTILACTYTLYFAKPVMLPIVGAFLLNLLFSPLVAVLKRYRVPYVVGTGLVMACAVTVVAVTAFLSAGPAKAWLQEKDKNIAIIEKKLLALKNPFNDLLAVTNQIEEMAAGNSALAAKAVDEVNEPARRRFEDQSSPSLSKNSQDVVDVAVRQPSISSQIFSTTGDALIGISLMLVLLFYLLASGDRGLEKLVEIMPTFKHKKRVVELTYAIQRSVSRYLLTTTVINVGLGIVIGMGMWLMGMPNPIMWGVMAMLLNYLPFIGAFIGAGIVFLAAIISFDSLAYAGLAPAIYLVANFFEANFITPVQIGRSVSLHPVWLMIFFIIVSWVWGVGGAIVAVPLLAVIKISCDHIEPLMPLGAFLGR